ncbi:hypothetical protein AG1IA_09400 [Rhizoctonia solani AG-1 IA]|uniref:Uncharacterized protein n=1 Tax=Thanatephorus cucumeris (strain AG1-IA) TaxID=983506 RepID=L8WID8_THACA|nr:hypothetical protein AG1IA_09400 [Rhizoctonia solani AG-1 IA]
MMTSLNNIRVAVMWNCIISEAGAQVRVEICVPLSTPRNPLANVCRIKVTSFDCFPPANTLYDFLLLCGSHLKLAMNPLTSLHLQVLYILCDCYTWFIMGLRMRTSLGGHFEGVQIELDRLLQSPQTAEPQLWVPPSLSTRMHRIP